MKTRHRSSGSIEFNIFIMTLAEVSAVMFLACFVFLAVFSGIIHDTVETQAREINKQIVMNFEGYINSVVETAAYIQFASLSLDTVRDSEELENLYQMNTEIKKDVVSIYLFDRRARKIAGPPLDPAAAGSLAPRAWFSSALRRKEIYNFSAEQRKSIAEGKDDLVISVSKAVEYRRDGKSLEGVLLIELNNDSLTDLARKTNLGQLGHILILDDSGHLVYSSAPAELTELSAPIAADVFLGSRRATIAGTNMYISANTLIQTRWILATVSNTNEIRGAMSRLAGILMAIFLLAIPVSALLSGVISVRVSQPINQLRKAMRTVEGGDFSVPVSVSGQREIVALAHSFNAMIQRVQELMSRLLDQQTEKRKLELQVLQNQINPHFLYNTLDSIIWLAEHSRNADVITTVVALAHFFRISISKGEIFISVEDEIFHVRSYLTIQSIRYSNKFSYQVDIEEGILGRKVMKLILQPLVENAIYHGIGDEAGRIDIKGRELGDFLYFSVSNTGYGISEATISQMYQTMRGEHSRPSVGIRNVYQRLRLYYGEGADILVESVPDESTTVTIVIPKSAREGP